ncbi:helix-turn-helix domain-containing protein [Streptomyces sp. NPDC059740]|uniref:helix-turn-helix domain-containing protein n=1 Tax=Streptomyces sp. NPDC059740 TaxID=3346926 RepID=UPI00364793B9
MASIVHSGSGPHVAYERRLARLTQADLARRAGVALGTVRKIEQGARGVSDRALGALAQALDVDVSRLLPQDEQCGHRVHEAMPALSEVLASYEMPDDGPVRALSDLQAAVEDLVAWRLGAQYVRIARTAPAVLAELCRAVASSPARLRVACLLVDACRAADAVAYKHGAVDVSARLIDVMRWAAGQADDPLVAATVAYVRTEVFFSSGAHSAGLRMLAQAVEDAPGGAAPEALAARGALHMRAAVIAGRAGDAVAADDHLGAARSLADRVPEQIYRGTAFGPDSVRIHEMSVAVSLGGEHLGRVVCGVREWAPPRALPAERRSGYYIELGRAQLWTGRPNEAFESLRTARRIAPQHVREHRWVREDAARLRRLKRGDAETLSSFAEWCHALP